MNTSGLRTWIEVDSKKMAHNMSIFRSVLGQTKIMAVVKSNAYGHGLFDFAKSIVKDGADWLGVDSVTEALRLRKEGIQIPILVLGYTLPEKVEEAAAKNISLTVSSFETLESWRKLKLVQPIKIHIKADTGLHRQGFLKQDLENVIRFLKENSEKFSVEGLYTHFAQAKNPESREYTQKQIQEFEIWISEFKKAGFSPIIHASATAGALIYPEARFDMVRIGAGLYGIWPSKETKKEFNKSIGLQPVLSWRTIISEIKKLPNGVEIGYDLTETLTRDSVIAICPIGYWHGYSRSLSSKGYVLVHGKRVKVLGRVAMDMIVIDVTDIPDVNVHDTVTLIGEDSSAGNSDEINAEELAQLSDTSTYEFLTRLNPLMRRIIV